MTFKPGDVVRLKPGPLMTVEHGPRGDPRVYCVWHDAEGDVQRKAYLPSALERAEAPVHD